MSTRTIKTTARQSTLLFRTFRDNLTKLSSHYWFYQSSADALGGQLKSAQPDDRVVTLITPSFSPSLFSETAADVQEHRLFRDGIFRLHLLVIMSGHFEFYIKRTVMLYIAGLGYSTGPYELSTEGHKMGSKILKISNIPKMLIHTEKLLSITFGAFKTPWDTAYPLRCFVAHNGGIVTPTVLDEIPGHMSVGERLVLEWSTLQEYMDAARKIATQMDEAIATSVVRQLELEWYLVKLQGLGNLPEKKMLWTHVHSTGFKNVDGNEKRRLESILYP